MNCPNCQKEGFTVSISGGHGNKPITVGTRCRGCNYRLSPEAVEAIRENYRVVLDNVSVIVEMEHARISSTKN